MIVFGFYIGILLATVCFIGFLDMLYNIIKNKHTDITFGLTLGVLVCSAMFALMTYMCYTKTTSDLSTKIDNGDTYTIIEHSLSGDSVIIENVSKPVNHTATVIKVYTYDTLDSFGYVVISTEVTYKVDNGIELKKIFDGKKCIKLGSTIDVTEVFYPVHYYRY